MAWAGRFLSGATRLTAHHAARVAVQNGQAAVRQAPALAGHLARAAKAAVPKTGLRAAGTALGLAGAGAGVEFAIRKDAVRGYASTYDFMMTAPDTLDETPIDVLTYDHISPKPLSELNDDEMYEIAISKKPGFKEELEFLGLDKVLELAHASFAVKVDDTYALYGRQSPYFREENPGEFGVTQIENEADYKLLGDTHFHITDLKMKVSGKDIKEAIAAAEQQVCRDQDCDMYSSNCYSAASAVLLNIHKRLEEKPDGISQSASDSIKSGIGVLCLDNWMVGMATNPDIAGGIRRLAKFDPKVQLDLAPKLHL